MTARHSASGPGRNPVEPGAKTYEFEVKLETDEDGWHVFYPPWSGIGASTWGYTRKEALDNIREVLSMIVEELLEEGKPVSVERPGGVSGGESVFVTV